VFLEKVESLEYSNMSNVEESMIEMLLEERRSTRLSRRVQVW